MSYFIQINWETQWANKYKDEDKAIEAMNQLISKNYRTWNRKNISEAQVELTNNCVHYFAN
jgi:hypothetical protein